MAPFRKFQFVVLLARLAAPGLVVLVALREIVAAVEVGDVDGFSPSGTWFREAKAALNKVEGI